MKIFFVLFSILLFSFGTNDITCDNAEAQEQIIKSFVARTRSEMKSDPHFAKLMDSVVELKYPVQVQKDSSALLETKYAAPSDARDNCLRWVTQYHLTREFYKKRVWDSIPGTIPVKVALSDFQRLKVSDPDFCLCSAKKFIDGDDSAATIYYAVRKNKDGAINVTFRSAEAAKELMEK